MWFKQIQLFQVPNNNLSSPENMAKQLELLAFTPCVASLPSSAGWVAPLDEMGAGLVHTLNGCSMICLQLEEKILPAAVISQELKERIKQIEMQQERKVRQKEKMALKEEVIFNLMPRAFTKLTKIYAYIDVKNHWLILNTTHKAKTEKFISLLKKTLNTDIYPLEIKKLAPIITNWLKQRSCPGAFSIEKACVLQDPQQQTRIIRAQQQDLFAIGIQSLLKDGCEVKQLTLVWQDRVKFIISDNLSLRSIKFQDGINEQVEELEAETKRQKFDANFLIMTGTYHGLLQDLIELFLVDKEEEQAPPGVNTVVASA